jgi:hypothetical protein
LTASLTSGHGATGLAHLGRLLTSEQVLSPIQAKVKPETDNRHKTAKFFSISLESRQFFITFPKKFLSKER